MPRNGKPIRAEHFMSAYFDLNEEQDANKSTLPIVVEFKRD